MPSQIHSNIKEFSLREHNFPCQLKKELHIHLRIELRKDFDWKSPWVSGELSPLRDTQTLLSHREDGIQSSDRGV